MSTIVDLSAVRRERERTALLRERDTLRRTLRQSALPFPPYATLWRLNAIERRLFTIARETHADLTAHAILCSGKLCVTALSTIETEFEQSPNRTPESPDVKQAIAAASAFYADFMEQMTALAFGLVPATDTERSRIAHLAKLSGEGYARILRKGSGPP